MTDGRLRGDDPLAADDLAKIRTLLGKVERALFIGGEDPPPRMIEEARAILARRRLRSRIFPASMFGEAAWDMVMTLYVADAEHRTETLASLTRIIEAPPTSALRWCDYLIGHCFVERTPHPTDGRAAHVRLTDTGRSHLERYLLERLRTGA